MSLRYSAEAWSLLFAAGVLLVEGQTEVGAFPIWFDKITQEEGKRSWAARDFAIFSVGGQSGFRSWARFLHHYRVPLAVCCDGQALDPWQAVKEKGTKVVQGWARNRDWIFSGSADATRSALGDDIAGLEPDERALTAAKDCSKHPNSPKFEQVRDIAARYRVCTVATWFQTGDVPGSEDSPKDPVESIDDLIEQDRVLAQAKAETAGGRSNVRVGAEVAARCDPPEAVRQLCGQVLSWLCDKGASEPVQDSPDDA